VLEVAVACQLNTAQFTDTAAACTIICRGEQLILSNRVHIVTCPGRVAGISPQSTDETVITARPEALPESATSPAVE